MSRAVAAALALALVVASASAEDSDGAVALLDNRCSACHGGATPAAGLRLTAGALPASVAGVASTKQEGAVLVVPGDARASYLLAKVEGRPGITGTRMPPGGGPLSANEVAMLEEWVSGLQGAGEAETEPRAGAAVHFSTTRLINLPTTETVGARDVQFRVSHRFVPAATSGYDPDFFGLNGPAHIMLQLAYGLSAEVSLALAHSNLYHEYEASVRWRFLSQAEGSPVSAALVTGAGLVTQEREGTDLLDGENIKLNLQLPVSGSLGDRVALLVVPSYSTNTNHWSDESEATAALGVGCRLSVTRPLSLMAEWVPVLDGYGADYDAWAAGLDYEVGGHVFQVFAANSTGVLTDQYLPGGYPELGSSDLRLGFNIFRTFWR